MDNTQILILSSILLPFIGTALNIIFHRWENLRDILTLTIAIFTFVLVILVLIDFTNGGNVDFMKKNTRHDLKVEVQYINVLITRVRNNTISSTDS